MQRKHFHSFDALRFFSFLLVFLLHIPKTNIPLIDFFLKSGGIGVSFFFVLSGFLITYILIYEKEKTNKISLKKFFARRILRIWPLFYAMIIFAFLSKYALDYFNIPHNNEGYKPNWIVSIFFGENYKMMQTGTFPDGTPLRVMWTLCIEEHFYILWGVSMFFISKKKIPMLILISIILANTSRIIYSYFNIKYADVFSNLDYFAYGAIPAYMLIYKQKYISLVDKIPLFWKYFVLTITFATVFVLPNLDLYLIKYFSPTLLGLLFSSIILFTLGENSIQINDNLWFSKLGIYTYGLYLYHTIIILFLLQFSKLLEINISWLLFTIISLLLTIIISMTSYNLFEKQFLKLKKYFY